MENQSVEQLPIFVYGTLRPGGSNYGIIRHYVESFRPAVLFGFQMYSLGRFPGILENPVTRLAVSGDLLTIKQAEWEEAIERLDRYEANGYLFTRTDKFYASIFNEIVPGKNTVRVWTYVPNQDVMLVDENKIVHSNDWFNR